MQDNDTQLSSRDALDASKDRLNDAFIKLEKVLKTLSVKDSTNSKTETELTQLITENTKLTSELEEVKEKYSVTKAIADQVLGELNQSINIIQGTLGKNDNS